MGWFPQFKIAHKLPLALAGSALVVSAGVGLGSYFVGSSIVADMSARQMETSTSRVTHVTKRNRTIVPVKTKRCCKNLFCGIFVFLTAESK